MVVKLPSATVQNTNLITYAPTYIIYQKMHRFASVLCPAHAANNKFSFEQKRPPTLACAMLQKAPMPILDEAASLAAPTVLLIRRGMDKLHEDSGG